MSIRHGTPAGYEARQMKGWLGANAWLVARRTSQLSILLLFLAGPWWGLWIVKGNLNASLTLDVLPLTDPFVALQSLVTGHWPETTLIIGAVMVVAFYMLVGGRVYCSWVCPINPVSDAANWLRRRLGLKGGAHISAQSRYWLIALILLLCAITGTVVWELVNPVSMLHRGLIFGIGSAWLFVLAVFLFELLVAKHGWCGRLCPVGAFYSLVGYKSFIRVRAENRNNCDDCMDCYEVCPEPKVLKPALRGGAHDSILIDSATCTNCARCIDVCSRDVFRIGSRLNGLPHPTSSPSGTEV